MKFREFFNARMRPAWERHYIRYEKFADEIPMTTSGAQRASELPAAVGPEGSSAGNGTFHEDAWLQKLEEELQRVRTFIDSKAAALQRQLVQLMSVDNRKEMFLTAPYTKDQTDAFAHQIEPKQLGLCVVETLGKITDSFRCLNDFVRLNHYALCKLMEKFGDARGMPTAMTELLPRLDKAAGLADNVHCIALGQELASVGAELFSTTDGELNNTREFVDLAAGRAAGRAAAADRTHLWLGFAFGCNLVLALVYCVAVRIQTTTGKNDSIWSCYPAFYLPTWLSFLLFGCGVVAYVCEQRGIRYRLFLGIDRKCTVDSACLFRYAFTLNALVQLCFACHAWDYRFIEKISTSTYHARYPSVLLVIIFIYFAMPGQMSYQDKRALLRTVGRVIAAPFFVVTFGDIIVGDVLTSLSGPLSKIPLVFCYFYTIYTEGAIEKEDLCPTWMNDHAVVLISALPYIHRALQCVRRFRDDGTTRHLLNLGKYLTAISYILSKWEPVKAVPVVQIAIKVASTMYSGYWDIKMDWGLPWSIFKMPGSATKDAAHTWERCFAPRTYVWASVFDILARLHWVSDKLVAGVVKDDKRYVFFMTILEITRRTIWAILRIEHEQEANGGGFNDAGFIPITDEEEVSREDSLTIVGNTLSVSFRPTKRKSAADHIELGDTRDAAKPLTRDATLS